MKSLRTIRYATWGAVILVGAILAAFVITSPTGSPWQLGSLWAYVTGNSPAPIAIGGPFTLTDQTGATVTEAALKGHPSALFFGYTYCPDVCPTTLYELTVLLGRLGPDADKLKVYFVTVDPERDTQAKLAEYLQAFDPRISGLTGTRPQIDQMLKAYRVYSRKVAGEGDAYLMDHTASVYLLDANADFAGTFDDQEKEDAAFAKLQRLVGSTS